MDYMALTKFMSLGSIAILVVVVAVYDIYIIAKKGKYYSVSAWMIRNAKKFPSIPFGLGLGIGMLAAHLFWNMAASDIYLPDSPEMKEICRETMEILLKN